MFPRFDTLTSQQVTGITERAIQKEIQQKFANAEDFLSADRVLRQWLHARGWIYGCGLNGSQWVTMDISEHGNHKRGPSFETYGEMIEFLLKETNTNA